MHDKVDVPLPPVTVVGVRVHERLVEFEPTARATVPANAFAGVTVTVEAPAEPAIAVTGVGLALTAKSWTVNVIVIECERLPLVPVTVTGTIEVDEKVQDSVELPEPVTVEGLRAHDVLFETRLTIPAKPFRGVTVMLDVPAAFTSTLTLGGVPVTVKS